MNLAIFEPDIPHNTGAMIRICACFNINLDIIHPASFTMTEKSMARVAMDYKEHINLDEFDNWEHYMKSRKGRKILLSTMGRSNHYDLKFKDSDNLIVGRESAGVPDEVHKRLENRIKIPMIEKKRSLNLASSVAIVLSENIRQSNIYGSND
jgi:tRNA (cytidine/uridine-2'-O-)-methyltransferase